MLDILGERMNAALAEKQKCQDEADATALTIDLANRLVNGLASEKIRWNEEVEMLIFIYQIFECLYKCTFNKDNYKMKHNTIFKLS